MIIRKARKKDVGSCLNIQKLDKALNRKRKDFEKSITDMDVIFLVAENNKKLLGYILGFITPTKRIDVLIDETRVDKRERGKKIGTKLVNAFCKESFKKGAKDIYAEIDSRLLKFYRDSCKFKKSKKWIEVVKHKD